MVGGKFGMTALSSVLKADRRDAGVLAWLFRVMASALCELHMMVDNMICKGYKKPLLCIYFCLNRIKSGIDPIESVVNCSKDVMTLDDRREILFQAVRHHMKVWLLHLRCGSVIEEKRKRATDFLTVSLSGCKAIADMQVRQPNCRCECRGL